MQSIAVKIMYANEMKWNVIFFICSHLVWWHLNQFKSRVKNDTAEEEESDILFQSPWGEAVNAFDMESGFNDHRNLPKIK